jgi:anti-sigma B factor antagonist
MEVTTITEEIFYIIGVAGDLDASSSVMLDEAFQDAVALDKKMILVDCTQLNYISSAGLGVFMSYLSDFENQGIALRLFGMSEKVKNVFEMLGLEQLVQIVDTKQEAKKSI